MRIKDVFVMLLASSVLGYWALPSAPTDPAPPCRVVTKPVQAAAEPGKVWDKPAEAVAAPVVQALPSIVSIDSVMHGVALPYATDWLTPPRPYEGKKLPGASYLQLGR